MYKITTTTLGVIMEFVSGLKALTVHILQDWVGKDLGANY